MTKFIFSLTLLFLPIHVFTQDKGILIPNNNKEQTLIGQGRYKWACVANFTLSDPRNFGRIKFLETDGKGSIYIIDNNGYLYALSAEDMTERWKTHLGYEHILDFTVSPDDKTLAICYNYVKTATKKLEVRRTDNGRITLKIKQVPNCYEDYYLADVGSNTTLYAYKTAYNPDGSRLAVWFRNHGFDENKCIAIMEEKLIIIDPENGDILTSRTHIPEDFEWKRCESDHPFVFSADGKSLYIGNCRAQIAQYDSKTLKLIKSVNFTEPINRIEREELNEKGSKKAKLGIGELFVQKDGSILAGAGKKGRVYKINDDLSSINIISEKTGNQRAHFSMSPDLQMIMLNSNNINLWNLKDKKPLFNAETPGAFDANTVRFHPTKKALIVGTYRTIKIIAPCPVTKIHIGEKFTATGHFLNAETSFCVQGKGEIQWAYEGREIYHKYAKEDVISTEILGYGSLFNSLQNLPAPTELFIKTDTPGTYTIFGGTMSRQTNREVLLNLTSWY